MRITVPILAALLATALFATAAHAQAKPNDPPPAEPTTVTTRFGGEILLADAATLSLGLALADRGPFILAYPVAAPLVHLAHGDPKGALGSFALHLGAPLVGGMLGLYAGAAGCGSDKLMCAIGGGGVGLLLGVLTATIVDATALAHVERPVPRRAQRTLPTPTVAVAPGGGFMVGLAGRL